MAANLRHHLMMFWVHMQMGPLLSLLESNPCLFRLVHGRSQFASLGLRPSLPQVHPLWGWCPHWAAAKASQHKVLSIWLTGWACVPHAHIKKGVEVEKLGHQNLMLSYIYICTVYIIYTYYNHPTSLQIQFSSQKFCNNKQSNTPQKEQKS